MKYEEVRKQMHDARSAYTKLDGLLQLLETSGMFESIPIGHVIPQLATISLTAGGDPKTAARKTSQILEGLNLQCTAWVATPGGHGYYNWEMHCSGIKFELNCIQVDVPQPVNL